ncbi:MAG: transglutaminase domain-containing protein [Spirochaetia bacterium]|nr:transglutaminase domain-containing protein [Spirochaetia bacterium]
MKKLLIVLLLFVSLTLFANESIEEKIENKWGIDYSSPEKYLVQGPQSQIPGEFAEEIDSVVGEIEKFSDLNSVYKYIFRNYEMVPAGGRTIGTMTVEKILENEKLTGCHSAALFLASILRHNNTPAIMVDGANLNFVEEYPNHNGLGGHVYVEAYIDGQWILLNSTQGEIAVDYDYSDPVLKGFNDSPYDDPLGNYVMFKGLDPESYGIDRSDKLGVNLIAYAEHLNNKYDVEEYFENYDYDFVKNLNHFSGSDYVGPDEPKHENFDTDITPDKSVGPTPPGEVFKGVWDKIKRLFN